MAKSQAQKRDFCRNKHKQKTCQGTKLPSVRNQKGKVICKKR